jgi:hypothetical protein
MNRIFKFQSCLGVTLQRLKINNKRVLDSKHGVVVEILVFAVENLSSYRFVSVALDLQWLEMNHKRKMH